jgi:hypothetical protein
MGMHARALFGWALILSGLVSGCATPTGSHAELQASGLLVEAEPIQAQLDDPRMRAYIADILKQPQPERARLGNELLVKYHLLVHPAFDRQDPPDFSRATGAVLETDANFDSR